MALCRGVESHVVALKSGAGGGGAACTTANVLDTHSRVAVIRGPDLRSTRSPGVFRKVPLVQDTADVRPRNSHLPVQREGPAGLQEVQSGVLVQRSFRCGRRRYRVPGRGDRFRSDLRPGRANRSPSQGFPASGQGRTCPPRGSELGPEAVGGLGPALWTSVEGRRRHVKDAARPRDAPAAPPPGLSAQTVTRFPSYNRLWQSAQDAELTVFAAVRAQLGGVRHTCSVARPSPPPAVPSGTSSQTDALPHSALRPGPRGPPSCVRLCAPDPPRAPHTGGTAGPRPPAAGSPHPAQRPPCAASVGVPFLLKEEECSSA